MAPSAKITCAPVSTFVIERTTQYSWWWPLQFFCQGAKGPVVQRHSGENGGHNGGSGASLRCYAAKWERGNFSTNTAKLYA